MADIPPMTIQRDGEARSLLIRTDPYQETTNPGPDLGQRSPSGTGCDPQGESYIRSAKERQLHGMRGQPSWAKDKEETGRAGGDPSRTLGSPRPYSEKNCQTRPIVLDRKDSWPIAALCRLSRDVMASYLSGKRTWNATMRGWLFRGTSEV